MSTAVRLLKKFLSWDKSQQNGLAIVAYVSLMLNDFYKFFYEIEKMINNNFSDLSDDNKNKLPNRVYINGDLFLYSLDFTSWFSELKIMEKGKRNIFIALLTTLGMVHFSIEQIEAYYFDRFSKNPEEKAFFLGLVSVIRGREGGSGAKSN